MNLEPSVSDEEIHDAPGIRDAPLRAIIVIVAVVAIACSAVTILISRAIQPHAMELPPIMARPAALDFGNVPQSGIVQAVVLIEQARNSGQQARPNIAPGPPISISTLSGIARRLIDSRWVAQRYFIVDVDTSTAGLVESHITISWEDEVLRLPVRYNVRGDAEGRRRILIVQTPFNGRRLKEGENLDAWHALAATADFDVEYLDTTGDGGAALGRKVLAPFETILLATDAIELINAPEISESLLNFVEDGGILIIAANAYLGGSVDRTNEFVTAYGLELQYKQLPETNVHVLASNENSRLSGVKTLYFQRASPIRITDPAKARIIVPVDGLPDHAFVASARTGNGEIIVIGESQWWIWLGGAGKSPNDNARLLKNLLTPEGKELP